MNDEAMKECLEHCQRCHTACLSALATHCLEVGGKHVEAHHFKLMLDCAQICATSADFLLRKSALHAPVCAACAAICAACAESCAAVGNMDACVEACRTCAGSCRRMGVMAA